jgi:hypothetical protein
VAQAHFRYVSACHLDIGESPPGLSEKMFPQRKTRSRVEVAVIAFYQMQ